MASVDQSFLDGIIAQFDLAECVTKCVPYGNGHINDTFCLYCNENGVENRYILQRLNSNVFRSPQSVMSNMEKVTTFLQKKIDDPRKTMRLMPTKDGKAYIMVNNDCWRILQFVEDAMCLEAPETAEDFYQCALAFGQFQQYLSDFPAEELAETIPDFHNTPKRYRDLLKAIDEDVCGRVADVADEIAFIRDRVDFFTVLYEANAAGKLPLRVTHNDTKINNVMLDAATRTALCVIDLDTIMPGFSVTDFGDSIRFGANTAAEDEKDLSKVSLDLKLFDAYTKGYLDGCGGKMSLDEIMLMPEGAKMMTIECGMRFLTDYLQGDTYFKTKYPEHNLVRCRTQLKLVEDMERHWQEMKDIVRRYAE